MSRPTTLLAPACLELSKHQVLAFKRRPVEIHCLAGWLWVTDGMGGERVIEGGQRTVLRTRRKICIQAMTPSVVRIAPYPCALRRLLEPAPPGPGCRFVRAIGGRVIDVFPNVA